MRKSIRLLGALSLVPVNLLNAQLPKSGRLFEQNCVMCHPNSPGGQGPEAGTLRRLAPEAIVQKLADGSAHAQARQLSEADQRAIAEFLSGRNYMVPGTGDAAKMPNVCRTNPPISSLTEAPAWNGWGADSTNGRFQTAKAAGLPADRVSRLKLKWAFGFPGATAVYGQPTLAARRVFVGLNNGLVYSLDASTGCAYWSFPARSGVRTCDQHR